MGGGWEAAEMSDSLRNGSGFAVSSTGNCGQVPPSSASMLPSDNEEKAPSIIRIMTKAAKISGGLIKG